VDEGVPVEVRLSRAARLEGRVTAEPGGGPAAGAVVHVVVSDREGLGASSAVAVAGPDGRYALEGLRPRDATLTVRGGGWIAKGANKRGFAAARVVLAAGAATTVDLVAVRGCRAEGVVLDAAGTPVAGARVQVEESVPSDDALLGGAEGARRWHRWATGADGRFVVDDLLPGGLVRLRASAPGEVDAVSAQARASFEAPIDVRLQFAPSRALVVTVVDDAGKPVPRAWASASWPAPAPGTRNGSAAGPPSGPDGVVRVGPIAGGGRLEATASAWARDHRPAGPATKVVFEAGQSEAAVTVVVVRGHSIEGRVTWPEGARPVEVAVEAHGPSGAATESAWPPDGAFRFRGLPAGRYRLTVGTDDSGVAWKGSAEADAGATDVVVALEATVPAFLVRLAGPDGRPVPRAQVRISLRDARGGTRDSHGQATDGVARFDDEVPADWTWVEARVTAWDARRRDGSALPFGPADAVVTRGRAETTLVLPAELAISGRVVDPDGRGVGGVWVTAQRVLATPEPNAPTGGGRTAADGSFRVGGLAEGEHVVAAGGGAWLGSAGTRAVTGDADVRLVLRPTIEVRVTVVDDSGLPVPRCGVNVQGAQASSGGQTDVEGVALLVRLAPGDLATLDVRPPSDRPDLNPLRRERWTPRDEHVRLERALGVAGWVRDASGRGVPGAHVFVGSAGTTTAEDGAFAVERVPAGESPLRVRLPADDGPARFDGVVSAGRRDVVVTIDPGCALEVTVDGLPAGSGVGAALLLVRSEGRAPRAIAGLARGTRIHFTGLSPETTYAFYGSDPSQERVAYLEPVRCGEAVRARAVPVAPVTVTVRAPRGECSGVGVDLGGWWLGGRRLGDATRWEVPGVPDGVWTLRAWGQTDDGKTLVGTAQARGRAAEVELTEAR
jgi:hypothetical protein